MKFVCLVYGEEPLMRTVPDAECMNCGNDLRDKGVLLSAEPLYPVETAKTLRIRNGRTTITDGPFTETKEQLAGFYLIDAPNHEEALKLAAKIPPAREGSIEVRPVRELAP